MSKTIVLTSVLALGALHCGGSSNRGGNMPEGSTTEENAVESTPSVGVGPGDSQGASTDTEQTPGSEPAGPSATALSDPQIAMITEKVNTAEIEQARIAQSKSKNEEVRRFASMMIEHHGKARAQQQALGLATAESALSQQLEQKAKMTLETLKGKTGDDFDRAYLQAQVEGHQEALDTIRQLQPKAQNTELRSYLDELTPQVEQHLARAQSAQQSLQSGTSSTSGPTGMR